jgi:membrane-associated phospholipid phosphatase
VFSWDARLQERLTGYWRDETLGQATSDAGDLVLQLADPAAATLLVLCTWMLFRRGRRREAVLALGAAGATLLLTPLLKAAFARGASDLYSKYELPSGHATRTMYAAVLLIVLLWSTRGRWAVAMSASIFVVAVGASVVYFDWHLTSDVLGGWALAGVALAVGAPAPRATIAGRSPAALRSYQREPMRTEQRDLREELAGEQRVGRK